MSNIIDYIKWRGDVTFDVSPFNAVDALILSQLSYMNMGGIVNSGFRHPIVLREAAIRFQNAPDYQTRSDMGAVISPLSVQLLHDAGMSARFGNIGVCGYRCNVDEERGEQFCAMTFLYDDAPMFHSASPLNNPDGGATSGRGASDGVASGGRAAFGTEGALNGEGALSGGGVSGRGGVSGAEGVSGGEVQRCLDEDNVSLRPCALLPNHKRGISPARLWFNAPPIAATGQPWFRLRRTKKCAFVAYRGTDDTIVGWKEDFNMAIMETVPAQLSAAAYLAEATGQLRHRHFCVGGHSKGGNLAVYAAAVYMSGGLFCEVVPAANSFAREGVKARDEAGGGGDAIEADETSKASETGNINKSGHRGKVGKGSKVEAIYNMDGPGFADKLINSVQFRAIVPLIKSYYPKFSIVGMIFSHAGEETIVESDAALLMQHDPFSWQVERVSFVQASSFDWGSAAFHKSINTWLSSISEAQRALFVETLFNVIEATGAKTNSELESSWFKSAPRVIKALALIPSKTREQVIHTVQALLPAVKKGISR